MLNCLNIFQSAHDVPSVRPLSQCSSNRKGATMCFACCFGSETYLCPQGLCSDFFCCCWLWQEQWWCTYVCVLVLVLFLAKFQTHAVPQTHYVAHEAIFFPIQLLCWQCRCVPSWLPLLSFSSVIYFLFCLCHFNC